jgi:son of sevenless-like protein
MTAVAYGTNGHHNGFASTPLTTTSNQSLNSQTLAEDQYITTFFCRALYDYQTRDASSLSFHKDDIIEVLTQLESGWWDGLLRDERGWFPSNYVDVITDEEAEAALSASESPTDESTGNTMVDMSHALFREQSLSEHDRLWASAGLHQANVQSGQLERSSSSMHQMLPSSDFWMPQVTPDGQVGSQFNGL